MVCPICNNNHEGKEQPCLLCRCLHSLGMPPEYLKSNKTLYKGRMLKYFDTKDSHFIHGDVGTGKTWLMATLMREHVKSTRTEYREHNSVLYTNRALFVSFPEMILELKASIDHNSSDTEKKIIDKYGNIKSLFLDDVGSEKMSEYVLSTLFLLIERRSTMKGRTVITSNLDLGGIEDRYNERIASRISELCTTIKISGVDRRIR